MGVSVEEALTPEQKLPVIGTVRHGRYVVFVDRAKLMYGTVSADDYVRGNYGSQFQRLHFIEPE